MSRLGDNRVASVVVTYQRVEPLRRALHAILAQSRPPDAIYVVDNASGDGTTEGVVRSEFPQVAYVPVSANLGFAAGLTTGMKAALESGADRVWLHDDDSAPAPSALEQCVTMLDADADIGVVGLVGGMLHRGMPRAYGGPYWRMAGIEFFWSDYLLLDGALVDIDTVRTVGYPRSDFFMMMEDMEYTSRITRAGFKMACIRDDLIFQAHLGSGCVNPPPWRAYYQTRNQLVMAIDRRSAKELIGWAIRQLKFIAGTLLYLDRKAERVHMRALGAWHGFRGVMGRTIEPTPGWRIR